MPCVIAHNGYSISASVTTHKCFGGSLENISVNVSVVLRGLRRQRGWSLDVASEKTSVSKAMLGQVERGESNPSIAILWKIAKGFGVPFSTFVEGLTPYQQNSICCDSSLQELHQEGNNIKVKTIFPFDEKLEFEVFMLELPAGCTHVSRPHQQGSTELVMPLNGAVEVMFNGVWHLVNQFEGCRFDAGLEHGYRNLSDKPVLIQDIIHYNRS